MKDPSDGTGIMPDGLADDRHVKANGKRKPANRKAHTPTGAAHDHASLSRNLAALCDRDDGWLRVVRARDEETLFLKWKFTRGHHAGCYVMARVQYWQYAYGLELLLDKIDAVEIGSLKPTRDTAYVME